MSLSLSGQLVSITSNLLDAPSIEVSALHPARGIRKYS
jgi:hypothetical protein